jgi:thiol:disulfide interchange protein DsbD
MIKRFSTILGFFFLLVNFSITASGQMEYPEDKVKAKFTVEQNGCEATIIATITVVPKWHINAVKIPPPTFLFPSTLKIKKNANFVLVGGTIEPKPHFMHDEMADEDLYYHEGTFKIKQKIKITGTKDFTVEGYFEFQTCNDVRCLTDYQYPIKVQIKGCQEEEVLVDPSDKDETAKLKAEADSIAGANQDTVNTAAVSSVDDKAKSKSTAVAPVEKKSFSLWGVFFTAFLSGFLALIMPCVFPMIPMTVSFFTKQSKSRSAGIKKALMYGLSIVLIHVFLALIVVATGSASLLNELSTNPWFNLFFFVMLFVFGLSFLGAFEIQLPSKWVNAADAKADKGGYIGVFFMALVLSLASFSCTGPILGALLVGISSDGGNMALIIGMFAFGLALALPFTLFSIFPSMMTSMPSSGGWLNVVKVFLGFLEIAFAFKFLSTFDTTLQLHILEREVFIAAWVAIFGTLAIYLLGFITLPHDSKVERLSVGRAMLGVLTLAFTLYLLPGMWGAPLKAVNAFLPPTTYAESPRGVGYQGGGTSSAVEHVEGMHDGPQGTQAFTDYDLALAYAKKVNKPLFIDFTGWGCVNCRKMENTVWGEPGVIELLRNDVVIVSLYVDERTELPKEEQSEIEINGRKMSIKTIGNKWTAKQIIEYGTASQPYYMMQNTSGEDLPIGSADYQNHSNKDKFQKWIESGLSEFGK